MLARSGQQFVMSQPGAPGLGIPVVHQIKA
jgi:hypothetical protein